MKSQAFIIFFAIVLLLYGAVNCYIFVRGLQSIPSGSVWRIWFPVVFWIFASTFILARVFERACPSRMTAIFTWIGSFWLGFMLLFFLAVLLIDLIRAFDYYLNFIPGSWLVNAAKTKLFLFWSVLGISVFVVVLGFINARIPRIQELNLTIPKPNAVPGEWTVVMASDIHLGTIIASRKASRLVENINAMNPDLVLFAGDILDEDLAPVIRYNLGEALHSIKSRFGVYAITGNHEYIGGVGPAANYLEAHGVRMLRDTAVLIDGKFFLVGREDRDKYRFTGQQRKTLEEIMSTVDTTRPVILLDHQPFDLKDHSTIGIDLQLSGHTHHGQIWPLNYITGAIYELSRGYKQIGKTHFYVSSGYGTWGPPLRLGNRPEIVRIRILFTN